MEEAVLKLMSYIPTKVKEEFVVDWNGSSRMILPSSAKASVSVAELPPFGQNIHAAYVKLTDDEVKSFIQFLEKHPSLLTAEQIAARIKVLDFLINTIVILATNAETYVRQEVKNQDALNNMRPLVEFILQVLYSMKDEAEAAANPLGMSAVELGLGISTVVLLFVILMVSSFGMQ